MPAISKIRFTNLVYENGAKRYRDEIFRFDSHNGVILLENGGGKTVLVQALLQVVLPHAALARLAGFLMVLHGLSYSLLLF
jgi:ABC-type Mn2+/Zn2+ transport system ATPase subunit